MGRIAAGMVVLLLGACATAPQQPPPQLSGVPAAFEMTGRIAIRQGQRSDIAKLRWTHGRGSDVWVISSPLGNEVARIQSGPAGATAVQAGGGAIAADDFPALTERLLGVALDPNAMVGWLHGAKPANVPGDWQVAIEETQRAGEVDLSKRITASRGDTTVRLVVDEYRPLQE
jgi:outer membrane biogenesis lipoprotein LolB